MATLSPPGGGPGKRQALAVLSPACRAGLSASDLPLSLASRSGGTLVHSFLEEDQVTPLIQPLSLSLNELLLIYLISSKQNVVLFP